MTFSGFLTNKASVAGRETAGANLCPTTSKHMVGKRYDRGSSPHLWQGSPFTLYSGERIQAWFRLVSFLRPFRLTVDQN